MWINNRNNTYSFGLRNITNKYIPQEELEDFAFWAFGDNYIEFDKAKDFVDAWNQLHDDIYEIDMSNNISEDIETMCELWKESGKPIGFY